MSTANKFEYSDAVSGVSMVDPVLEMKARKSLRAFTVATKNDYVMSWHHKQTCDALMKWVRGETPFLIISQPPRHGKSELASIRLPAFIFGIMPDAKIIATAYGDSLASSNNRSVQRVIDSSEYQRIFPGTGLSKSNIRTVAQGSYLRNSSIFEIVGSRGVYVSAGIGGSITGKGADFLIIDDPLKNDKEANSITFRDAQWEWFNATALTRLHKGGRVLLIMTRWHEDDLAGRLLSQSKTNPLSPQFVEMKLEAIREDRDNEMDPRDIGDALWSDHYPIEKLRQLEATLGPRWWNALYQQRPTALEGGIIKGSWIKYYTEMPKRFNKIIQSWDATFKDSDGSDYVVGQVWGVWDSKKWLLDQVRGRWGFTDTCEQMYLMSKKWPQSRRKLVEEKANGAAILDSLKRPGLMADGKTKRAAITGLVPIVPTESKSARLTACATDFQAGEVMLPHPSIAPWIGVVVDELTKFPNSKHDDCADATSQALNDLSGGGLSVLDKMTRG